MQQPNDLADYSGKAFIERVVSALIRLADHPGHLLLPRFHQRQGPVSATPIDDPMFNVVVGL